MAGLPQLKPISIRHVVSEAIRRALLEGRFRPGQALSEVALAAEMNVSRGPVREALLVLAQEGLVSHSQNYGFSVLRFTMDDAHEVQQVRLPLEVLALVLARERLAGDDIQILSQMRDQIVDAYRAGQRVDYAQYDLDFHQHIWERSGNQRLLASLKHLMIPYYAYGSAFKLGRPDMTPELLKAQHDWYLDFLQGTSSKSAEECVRFHCGL